MKYLAYYMPDGTSEDNVRVTKMGEIAPVDKWFIESDTEFHSILFQLFREVEKCFEWNEDVTIVIWNASNVFGDDYIFAYRAMFQLSIMHILKSLVICESETRINDRMEMLSAIVNDVRTHAVVKIVQEKLKQLKAKSSAPFEVEMSIPKIHLSEQQIAQYQENYELRNGAL